jgi:hypothetical protein
MKARVVINLWVVIVLAGLVWSVAVPAEVLARDLERSNGGARVSNGDNDEDDGATGAHIELRVQAGLGGVWTIVQWQDGVGRWHDVEGWRAQVEQDQPVNWWVAPEDTNTGPYRWLVYQDQDRRVVVWASEAFYLPKRGETLVVTTAVAVRPAPDRPDARPMMPPEGRPHDSVMPDKGRQPGPQMPDKQAQPDTLMPETGSVGQMPRTLATALSAVAALALVAGGLVAAFRKYSTT